MLYVASVWRDTQVHTPTHLLAFICVALINVALSCGCTRTCVSNFQNCMSIVPPVLFFRCTAQVFGCTCTRTVCSLEPCTQSHTSLEGVCKIFHLSYLWFCLSCWFLSFKSRRTENLFLSEGLGRKRKKAEVEHMCACGVSVFLFFMSLNKI